MCSWLLGLLLFHSISCQTNTTVLIPRLCTFGISASHDPPRHRVPFHLALEVDLRQVSRIKRVTLVRTENPVGAVVDARCQGELSTGFPSFELDPPHVRKLKSTELALIIATAGFYVVCVEGEVIVGVPAADTKRSPVQPVIQAIPPLVSVEFLRPKLLTVKPPQPLPEQVITVKIQTYGRLLQRIVDSEPHSTRPPTTTLTFAQAFMVQPFACFAAASCILPNEARTESSVGVTWPNRIENTNFEETELGVVGNTHYELYFNDGLPVGTSNVYKVCGIPVVGGIDSYVNTSSLFTDSKTAFQQAYVMGEILVGFPHLTPRIPWQKQWKDSDEAPPIWLLVLTVLFMCISCCLWCATGLVCMSYIQRRQQDEARTEVNEKYLKQLDNIVESGKPKKDPPSLIPLSDPSTPQEQQGATSKSPVGSTQQQHYATNKTGSSTDFAFSPQTTTAAKSPSNALLVRDLEDEDSWGEHVPPNGWIAQVTIMEARGLVGQATKVLLELGDSFISSPAMSSETKQYGDNGYPSSSWTCRWWNHTFPFNVTRANSLLQLTVCAQNGVILGVATRDLEESSGIQQFWLPLAPHSSTPLVPLAPSTTHNPLPPYGEVLLKIEPTNTDTPELNEHPHAHTGRFDSASPGHYASGTNGSDQEELALGHPRNYQPAHTHQSGDDKAFASTGVGRSAPSLVPITAPRNNGNREEVTSIDSSSSGPQQQLTPPRGNSSHHEPKPLPPPPLVPTVAVHYVDNHQPNRNNNNTTKEGGGGGRRWRRNIGKSNSPSFKRFGRNSNNNNNKQRGNNNSHHMDADTPDDYNHTKSSQKYSVGNNHKPHGYDYPDEEGYSDYDEGSPRTLGTPRSYNSYSDDDMHQQQQQQQQQQHNGRRLFNRNHDNVSSSSPSNSRGQSPSMANRRIRRVPQPQESNNGPANVEKEPQIMSVRDQVKKLEESGILPQWPPPLHVLHDMQGSLPPSTPVIPTTTTVIQPHDDTTNVTPNNTTQPDIQNTTVAALPAPHTTSTPLQVASQGGTSEALVPQGTQLIPQTGHPQLQPQLQPQPQPQLNATTPHIMGTGSTIASTPVQSSSPPPLPHPIRAVAQEIGVPSDIAPSLPSVPNVAPSVPTVTTMGSPSRVAVPLSQLQPVQLHEGDMLLPQQQQQLANPDTFATSQQQPFVLNPHQQGNDQTTNRPPIPVALLGGPSPSSTSPPNHLPTPQLNPNTSSSSSPHPASLGSLMFPILHKELNSVKEEHQSNHNHNQQVKDELGDLLHKVRTQLSSGSDPSIALQSQMNRGTTIHRYLHDQWDHEEQEIAANQRAAKEAREKQRNARREALQKRREQMLGGSVK